MLRSGRQRWLPAVSTALLAAVVLAGCASLPTSGPATLVGASGTAEDSVQFIRPTPQPGDSPRQIVEAFLLAGTEPGQGYATAREFLTAAAQATWVPDAGAVIFADRTAKITISGEPTNMIAPEPNHRPNARTVVLAAQSVGRIDAQGVYSAQRPGTELTVEFKMVQVAGQWRIDQLPPGLVIAQSNKTLAFAQLSLYFFTPDQRHLVPDVRWFARRSTLATTLTRQLLAGPADYLDAASVSAFRPGTFLSSPGVVQVEQGVATVDLSQHIRNTDQAQRQLIHTQVLTTLQQLPQVQKIRLLAQGTALSESAPLDVTTPITPATELYAVQNGKPVRRVVSTGQVEPLPDVPEGLAFSSLAVLPKRGEQVEVVGRVAGQEVLARWQVGAAVATNLPTEGAPRALEVDRYGWVWLLPASRSGQIVAVGPKDQLVTMSLPLAEAEGTLGSLSFSHEGARAAMSVVSAKGKTSLAVAGVVRSPVGEPLRWSSPPHIVQTGFGQILDVAWFSETTVVGLERPAAPVTDQAAAVPQSPQIFVTSVAGQEQNRFAARLGASAIAVPHDGQQVIVDVPGEGFWEQAGSAWVQLSDTVDLGSPSVMP